MVKCRKNGIKKGNMTIEAALLMPVILFVLLGVIYLFFWVHNRAWLTAAAYEAAVSGSIEGICEEGKVYETADNKSRELGSIGFFGADNLTVHTSAGSTVKVVYDLDTISGGGSFSWHLQVKGKAEVLDPVSWIRKIKSSAETIEGIGDGI